MLKFSTKSKLHMEPRSRSGSLELPCYGGQPGNQTVETAAETHLSHELVTVTVTSAASVYIIIYIYIYIVLYIYIYIYICKGQ